MNGKLNNKCESKSSNKLKIVDQSLNKNNRNYIVDKKNTAMIELQKTTENSGNTIVPKPNNSLKPVETSTVNNLFNEIGEVARIQLSAFNVNMALAMSIPISNIISQIVEIQRKFVSIIIEQIDSINPFFIEISNAIEEARKNPDSMINWINYYDKLSEFFWIMPYKMTSEELYEILNNVNNEKEFDKYINRYFSHKKVEELFYDTEGMLGNNNQRKVFKQILNAYDNKSYALASIGLTTMIDNIVSYYLTDKACSSRVGIFEPIINDLELKQDNSNFSFIVMMVNSNINLLYEKVEFNEKISIKTNKKVRRNPIAHGKSYGYKKIDTTMLMNTLYYLLLAQNELKAYKGKIYKKRNEKEFYIPSKEEMNTIKEKIKKNENNHVKKAAI